MRKLIISIGEKDNLAVVTRVVSTTWPKFVEFLTREPMRTKDKAAPGWYCPAHFEPAYRDGKNLVARHCLTFDYDDIDEWDAEEIKDVYKGLTHLMYTTASHTAEKPRLRIVFPLSRPVEADQFGAVTRKIAAMFDIEKLARESDKPAQMMFLPSVKPNGEFWFEVVDGNWVDVDGILEGYDDWTNRTEWPKRLERDSTYVVGELIVSPDTKPGIVGDFCRAFTVPAAIEKFELPYAPGSNEDRWTYILGSRPDGLRLYDEGLKGHSDHNTDPAHGQHNAFDIVRLHRFGDRDTAEDAEKPITERPSYKAMCKLALEQPEVQAQRVLNEFENLDKDLPEVEQKQTHLAVPLEVLLQTPSKPRWLLRDKLERGVIALMTGPRGTYKSFIALDWAMQSLAHGSVYVISAEGNDFDRRAQAWSIENGEVPPNKLFVMQRRIDLNLHDNIELVRQDCIANHKIKPVLFVLDTFSKLSGALDENSNTDVKSFIGRLDNGLKRAFDATVLLITHTGHSEKTRARGASALEADTDAAYIVSRLDSGVVTLSRERFKSSPELEPLALRPEIVSLGRTDDDGELISSVVMRAADLPLRLTKRDEPKGLYPKTALTTAKLLLKNGPLDAETLIDEAVKTLPEVKGARDTRKQQLTRAVSKLISDQWLFLHKGNKVALTTAVAADEEDWL
jgi:hypothetical protein